MESSLPSICMALLIAAAPVTEALSATVHLHGAIRADTALLSNSDVMPDERGSTSAEITSQGHTAQRLPKLTQGHPRHMHMVKSLSHHKTEGNAPPACAERKLVVNSHVKYVKALDHLVASLKEHKFPLKDCVVFRGGAVTNSGPRIGPDGMTFVDITLDSFDLNAFSGLSRYNNHSLVCADMYFYVHDSTQIGPCFPRVFDAIRVAPTEVITPGKNYFSNQCVFGRSVVDKFGDNFDDRVDKRGQITIESGGCSGKACSITRYAEKQTVIPERIVLGAVDVYNTSKPRTVTWYQEWDLYKFYLYQRNLSHVRTDLTLLRQDYEWAPSCPRKCTMEASNSPLCTSSTGAVNAE